MNPSKARLLSGYLSRLASRDLDQSIREAQKELSERGLRYFTEFAWHIIEPGREFIPGWHLDAIAEHLEAVTNGEIIRLLINIPPGLMKSLSSNVLWPAWEWGPKNLPTMRYVGASYSHDLTIRDNRRCRSIIQSPWYQAIWGDRFKLVSDQNAKTRFDNDRTGFKIATSVGGMGTGERGDRFVIDDGNNVKDVESNAVRNDTAQWFLEVVPTRLTNPEKSAIINIQQRTHQGDISGIILEKELGYVHLCLPMEFEPDRKCFVEVTGFQDPRTEENELIWPKRMTRVVVERDKIPLGAYGVAGQFQQRPSPRGGGQFKKTWWRFFKTDRTGRPDECSTITAEDLPDRFETITISVDAAFKDKHTGSRVGLLAVARRGPKRYVLANGTKHMTFTQTLAAIKEMKVKFPYATKILIEDKANGSAIIDTLMAEISGVVGINPEGGKEARAAAIEPTVETGYVFLPEGAPWLEDFIEEFALFPAGNRNDQVDALSQALIDMISNADLSRTIMMARW